MGRTGVVGVVFFFSSRRRHTSFDCDWSSDVCSSDLFQGAQRASNATHTGQNLQVVVDGVAVGSLTPAGTAYAPYATGSFTLTAGAHTVTLQGLNTAGGDNTEIGRASCRERVESAVVD